MTKVSPANQEQMFSGDGEAKRLAEEKAKRAREAAHQGGDSADTKVKTAMSKVDKIQTRKINQLTPQSPNRDDVFRDQALIMKVKEKQRKDQQISEDLAKQARDEEIRKNLLVVARAQKEKQDFRREETRLTGEIAELGKLAAAAMAAAAGMGEMKTPNGSKGTSPLISGKSKDSGLDSGVGTKSTEAEVKGALTKEQIAANEQEKAAMLKELQDGAPSASKIKDLSLKNRVAAQLRAAQAAESRMGSIENPGANQGGEAAKRENAAAKVVSEVLTPAAEADNSFAAGGGRSGNSFSLNNSETNAEVKRLTEDAERQLSATEAAAADIKAGILETDSVSLFERIKTRISGCLKQRCVNSRSIAQK